jgi:hypothetical protein
MSLIAQGLGGGSAPGETIELKIEEDTVTAILEVEKNVVTATSETVELITEKTNQMPVGAGEQLLKTEC